MQQSNNPAKAKIFFPNLDGLRFISFFVVFLFHSNQSILSYLNDSHPRLYATINFFSRHGNLGVNFFFVLSGFLITYLLIKEKELTGTIHIGKFYVRRILRIWPLYYLCVIIGFVVFPILKQMSGDPAMENAHPWYYISFFANFDIMHSWPVKPDALLLTILWSVAVEEQFYLSWPVILRFVPLKWFKFVFPAIMIFSLVFRAMHTGPGETEFAIRYFHTFSVIGDMALGGLLAYLVSYENRFKSAIVNLPKAAILFIYLAALGLALFKDELFLNTAGMIFDRLVIGCFFGLIILEQNYAKNSLFKMSKFKTMSKLGIYTYGLYCLHLMGLYLAIKVMNALRLDGSVTWEAFAIFILAFVLALVISLSSYHLFEKWFLRWKDKFAFIVKK